MPFDDGTNGVWYDDQGRPHITVAPGAPVDNSQASQVGQGLPISNQLPAELPVETFNPDQPITPGPINKLYDIMTGGNGQERYQLFPERIVRSALSLPGNVMSGKVRTPLNPPPVGSEEDYSADPFLQRVQDMTALMGGGGVAMAERDVLGTAGSRLVQPVADAASAEVAPVFHSAVENAIKTASLKSANPDQWLGTIANAKGVKPEELDWTGLKDWLGEQQGPVSKEQVQDFLQQNKVGLGEVNKGGGNHWSGPDETGLYTLTSEQPTKYSKYQLPGGENYREKLLTLPIDTGTLKVVKNKNGMFNIVDKNGNVQKLGSMGGDFGSENTALEVLKSETGIENNYKSSHWDEPNILAHIRMNDRNIDDKHNVGMNENGYFVERMSDRKLIKDKIETENEANKLASELSNKKAIHIEEIQSDWHQQGREHGYKITDAQKQQLEAIDNKLTTGLSEGDIGNPNMDAVLKTAVDKKVISSQEAANYKQWSKGENSDIPDAPFKKTWLELAAKRIIREAAEQSQAKEIANWNNLVQSDPDKVAHALVKSGHLQEICE